MWKSLILLLLIFSCSDKENCGLPDYEKTRKCDLNLNPVAKRSLNSIATLSHARLRTMEITNSKGQKTRTEYKDNIYFDLNKTSKMFYIEEAMYDFYSQKLLAIISWEVPLIELNVDNIEINEYHSDFFEGYVAEIGFRANFNNPDAFLLKYITYDEKGKAKVTQCERRSYLDFTTTPKNAIQLKSAFTDFLKNMN